MSEHPKNEQAGDSLPPGLEYKPEYWEAALSQIEAKEKFLLWRNYGFAMLCILLLLASSGSWYYLLESDGNQLAALRQIEMNKTSEMSSASFENHGSASEFIIQVSTPQETEGFNDLKENNTSSKIEETNTTSLANGNSTKNEISKASEEILLVEAEAISNNEKQTIDEPSLEESFANNEENRIMLSGENQEDFQQPIPQGESFTTSEDTIVMQYLRKNASASNLLNEFNYQKELGNVKLQPILISSIETAQDFHRTPKGMSLDIRPYGLSLPLKEFNVQLIAGTSFITHYGSRTKDKKINPMLGLGVDYNMTKRWSFNTNLHYFSVKEIMRPFESVQTNYDFIFRTTTTTIETNKLHYLSLPLNLAFRIGERHQLSAGAGVSLLVQGDNLIKVEQSDSFTKSLIDEYDSKGYITGFETLNTYLNFGYNVYLNTNIAAGITYQYGLTDVTIDDYFNQNDKDQNTRVSATLRFNIH